MKSLKRPDGSYHFDITRSENLVAAMLGLIDRKTTLYKMNETENEFIFSAGDLSKDIPMDSIKPSVEMSLTKEFYEKTVTSAYADEIIQLAPTLSTTNEFAKFFSCSGNLLGVQLALTSFGYYTDIRKNINTLPASELLNAMNKFQGTFKDVYKNFLISNELIDEKDLKSYLFLDSDVIVNYLMDITRDKPSVSGDSIKNLTPLIFTMLYYSLFQTLCGVFLTIVGGLNHSVKSLYQIATDVSPENVIGLLVNNQLDTLGKDSIDSISDMKKTLLGLLATFYRLHDYIKVFTGYEFNDPMANMFATLGDKLYNATPDSNDDMYIDKSLLDIGRDFGISLETITDIIHPIMGYSSFGSNTFESDSTLPFVLVSPIHIFITQVDDINGFYKNSFTRLKDYVNKNISSKGYDEKEIYKGFIRVLIADSQSDASEVDTLRFFKVAAAAAYLRCEKNDASQSASVIADNYLAALYIKWFKSGKFHRPSRMIDGGGLSAYHELHQEVLMVVSYYQEFLTSVSKDISIKNAGAYQNTTMINLTYKWMNNCGKILYESATDYIPYFVTNLRNVTIAISSAEDFARCIQDRSIAAVTAEVISLIDNSVSLSSIVQKFEPSINELSAQKDINIITEKFDTDKHDFIIDVLDLLKGDSFEKRCFVIGGLVNDQKGVNHLDYVVYFVSIPIESLLMIWENEQTGVIDAKGLIHGKDLKFKEFALSFIEGGTANSIRQKAQSYNPMK